MGSSYASRNGRGGAAPTARHAKRAFDEGEDDLFALSLDDVMSDRPWTADELMGGGARPASAQPAPSAAPAPASVPADDFATRPIMQAPRPSCAPPHQQSVRDGGISGRGGTAPRAGKHALTCRPAAAGIRGSRARARAARYGS